ncbi:rhomboid family intramembrane serine protease [Kiritimatiellota bacterium B12222]|nr:rhomboid family intramembrane serine protease [Kiritimatiellota bacterium B12222]
MPFTFGPDPQLNYSPLCRALILVNVLVYMMTMVGDMFGFPMVGTERILTTFGLFPSEVVNQGMFWTPFTYMFLHGGLMHLVFNMLAIYLLGPDLEETFGKTAFLFLYFLSGWLGGLGFVLISYVMQGQITPCVGASGAIFGLLGGVVALYPKRIYVILPVMIPVRASVLATLLLSTHLFFILTPYGNNVAYEVHLVGGVTGFIFCATAAFLHRQQWKDVIPEPEIPYASVELETLTYRLAHLHGEALPEEDQKRYDLLKQALRFEDIPSLQELQAQGI